MYRAKPGPLGGGEDGLLPDRGSATSTARPGCPVGTPHRVTTFRLTLSRAMACRIARLSSSECMSRSVRVLTVRASARSHRSTSSADRSRRLIHNPGGLVTLTQVRALVS